MIKLCRISHRPFLMLEVLIAFSIIALAAIPLIAPHFMMVKAQKEAINQMKIGHAVHIIYVNVLEKMHKNEITLNDIHEKKILDVSSDLLKEINGYKATYQFFDEKHRDRDQDEFTVHKVTLELVFTPKLSGKKLTYQYKVFFGSKLSTPIANETGLDDEEYEEPETAT